MDTDFVIYIARESLETTLLVAAPAMAAAVVIGVGVALLQAVTSVRDMTLSLAFKIAGVGVTLLLTGSWSIQVFVTFTNEIFNHIKSMGG